MSGTAKVLHYRAQFSGGRLAVRIGTQFQSRNIININVPGSKNWRSARFMSKGISAEIEKTEKAELHVHTSGSVTPEFLLKWGKDINWADPSYPDFAKLKYIEKKFSVSLTEIFRKDDLASLKRIMESNGDKGEGLEGYLARMDLGHRLLHNNLPAWRALANDIAVNSYTKNNVTYLELRFPMIKPLLKPEEIVEAVYKGLFDAELECPGLKTAMIICTIKMFSMEQAQNIVDAMIALRKQAKYRARLIGIDTAGPEVYRNPQGELEKFDHEKFKIPFALARADGIKVVNHAGEQFLSLEDGLEAIRNSVEVLGAVRIGHALALGIDPGSLQDKTDGYGKYYGEDRIRALQAAQEDLIKFLIERGVVIEACLSSNTQTQPEMIPAIDSHPLGKWISKGLKVVLATDNLTTSHTDLTNEHLLAAGAFGLSMPQITKMISNGFESKLKNNNI